MSEQTRPPSPPAAAGAPERPPLPDGSAPLVRHSLQERSEIYYERPDIYEELSQAEDAEGKVFHALGRRLAGLDLLDLGCGSGKYLELFGPLASHATGLDASAPQLAIAQRKILGMPHARLVLGDAASAPLPLARYGVVIACWMLGTVLDPTRRLAIIERAMRHLAPGGSFFLVENDSSGAFEDIRGRAAASEAYLRWLACVGGFVVDTRIASQFIFPSLSSARRVMGEIWGPLARARIASRRIEHRILILRRDRAPD